MDVDKLKSRLQEPDVSVRVQAIDESIEILRTLAANSALALELHEGRIFVAERLAQFGSIIIQPLEDLITSTNDEGVKTLAGLVLLQLGSESAIEILIRNLTVDSEYAAMTSTHLSRAGIREAIEPIIELLETCRLEEVEILLLSLERLHAEVPKQIRTKVFQRVVYELEGADLSEFGRIEYLAGIVKMLDYHLPSHLHSRFTKDEILRKLL